MNDAEITDRLQRRAQRILDLEDENRTLAQRVSEYEDEKARLRDRVMELEELASAARKFPEVSPDASREERRG